MRPLMTHQQKSLTRDYFATTKQETFNPLDLQLVKNNPKFWQFFAFQTNIKRVCVEGQAFRIPIPWVMSLTGLELLGIPLLISEYLQWISSGDFNASCHKYLSLIDNHIFENFFILSIHLLILSFDSVLIQF